MSDYFETGSVNGSHNSHRSKGSYKVIKNGQNIEDLPSVNDYTKSANKKMSDPMKTSSMYFSENRYQDIRPYDIKNLDNKLHNTPTYENLAPYLIESNDFKPSMGVNDNSQGTDKMGNYGKNDNNQINVTPYQSVQPAKTIVLDFINIDRPRDSSDFQYSEANSQTKKSTKGPMVYHN
jgi:hypothetical protein